MKPLNLDNRPCSPISSNCVIWQGDDIPCINLCSGDTVSDVIHALATELCTIIEQLDVSNYDLTCLGASCAPVDFQALIQLLITKICEANGVVVDPIKSVAGCPDCVVTVAACFITGNQTTMQLVDYVNLIAAKVCDILTSIINLQTQITAIDNRVTILENAPAPSFTLPSLLVDCTLQNSPYIGFGGPATVIDVLLNVLINDDEYGYCALRSATGLPAAIVTAVQSQCIDETTPSISKYPVPMGTEYTSWITTPATVADAITNLWITICDMRDSSLSVIDTNTINLTYTAGVLQAAVQDTGWHDLLGFAFYNVNTQKPQCRRIGNVIHFRGKIIVPLIGAGQALEYTASGATDSYLLNTTVLPYTGAGGVIINTDGAILFNEGNSAIPVQVLPSGVLDGLAYNGLKIAFRRIQLITVDPPATSILTSLFSVAVRPDGVLLFALVKDAEAMPGIVGINSFDTSALNYAISHVVVLDKVPDFKRAGGSVVNGNPAVAGVQNVALNFTGYTYPFSCNANDEQEIGGFACLIDGIMGYIDPCPATMPNLLPSPDPCS